MSTSTSPDAPPAPAFEDRRATVIGTVVFCLVWATTLVWARLWTRGAIIKKLGIDDYMFPNGSRFSVLLAMYGSGIAIAHMTKYGLGRHIEVVEAADVPLYMRDFYVSIVMYCSALLFVKMTFLLQYSRVLGVHRMRSVYLASMVVVGGWALSQVLVGIFTCRPVSVFWDPSSALGARCIPNIPQWYINAAGNIATDVALLLLAIFSLGFFTVVISVVRIRYLRRFDDFSWENVASSLWSVGELTSALTPAPACPPCGPSPQGGGGGGGKCGSGAKESRGGGGDGSLSLSASEVELAPTGPKGNPF
ncbi:hypothetical protein VTG60DRAFT_4632 [Thermothelomyces hinnuleus]